MHEQKSKQLDEEDKALKVLMENQLTLKKDRDKYKGEGSNNHSNKQ